MRSYMSDKNRYGKQITICIFLLLVLLSSKLYREKTPDSVSTPSQPIETVISPPVKKTVIYKSVVPPVLKKSKKVNKVSVKTKLFGGLQLKEIFKCDMAPDENLVEQVRQALAFYDDVMPLKIKKHQIDELLTIRVISTELPINFSKSINGKIELILLLYKKWFDLRMKEPMTLNLVILPNMEAYSDVLSSLPLDSVNSQGLFWGNTNFAFVAYRTEQQLEQTIIHELVHALNYYLVGKSARWLNEGLAEYFKKIAFRIEDDKYIYSFNFDKPIETRFTMRQLVISEQDSWGSMSEERPHLYASSFKFISYLIKHREESNILRQLLHKEARSPCTELESSTYLNIINENIFNFSSEF
jgi:hypothetical protein